MQELTGLPVWIVCDDSGAEVHAFVFDESTSTAYDIRGALFVSEIIDGPWKTGKTIAPWTRKVSVTKKISQKQKL